MSATEELRRLLDERGVEYETDDRNGLRETIWCGTAAFQLSPTAKMTMIVTPKQAIAATLGNSRAERTCKNAEDHKTVWFICSVCGYLQKLSHTRSYCPNCGARVVE